MDLNSKNYLLSLLSNERILSLNDESSLLLSNEIDKKMSKMVESFLKKHNNNFPPITIFINSRGGDHYYAMKIFKSITEYPGQTTGYVLKHAYSGAVTILQSCKTRCMYYCSQLKIHKPQISPKIRIYDLTNEEIKALEENLKNAWKEICLILSQRSQKNPDFFESHDCLKLDAYQALKLKLIDEIIFY